MGLRRLTTATRTAPTGAPSVVAISSSPAVMLARRLLAASVARNGSTASLVASCSSQSASGFGGGA